MNHKYISDHHPKIQDVISKLRFLSKIDKHEKLDVTSLSLVADTWYNNLYRLVKSVAANKGIYWNSEESRRVSLNFIMSTTDEALTLAKDLLIDEKSPGRYRNSEENYTLNHSLGQMIITTLCEMDVGIQGLKKTYASDRMFISEVETFQDVLKAKILEIQHNCKRIPLTIPSSFLSGSTPNIITEDKRSLSSDQESHEM